MKYSKDNIASYVTGKITPISQDGRITGYGYLINGTIFGQPLLVKFDDGTSCNAYSIQGALDWMNKPEIDFSSRKFHEAGIA